MIVDMLERQRPLSLQDHSGPGRVEPRAKFAGALVHRVKEDAVGLHGGGQVGEHFPVALALAACAGVPRVVIEEDFHAPPVAAAAEVPQAG